MNNYYIGVDVGATKIAAGFTFGGKIIKKTKTPTQAEKGKALAIKNIIAAIKTVYAPKIKGIGIGIAGQINSQKGLAVSSPNFSKDFKNVPLAKIIQNTFKKPVLIDNDANCFALGEAIYGAGKNYKYLAGLTLGTGVGGGIVINKKIYHGRDGLAAEIGHTVIVKNGLKCSCGQNGHLEAYTSGNAMINLYQKLSGQKKDTFEIEALAKKGEKNALRVFKIMTEHLALGLANIINIFNPEIIILGGGLSRVDILTKPAIKLALSQTVYPALKTTKIVTSKLKDDAPLLGAVALFKIKR